MATTETVGALLSGLLDAANKEISDMTGGGWDEGAPDTTNLPEVDGEQVPLLGELSPAHLAAWRQHVAVLRDYVDRVDTAVTALEDALAQVTD